MSSSSTIPGSLSRAAFAGLIATGVFFGLALVCFAVYAVWRWRRTAALASQACLAQPYHVEEMTYTISNTRHSIMKPPAYSPSPWARDAEDQKVAVTMVELKSPALPGYSVPESMANELRASLAASSKATNRTTATAGSPTTPGVPSIVVTSPLSAHGRLPSIPPPLPIPTRNAEQLAFARYTMPPPTPTCHVTGMPLDLSMRTPPPVYNASMERAQREELRRQRGKGKRKSRWRDTLKSVKSVVSTS
ncbi:hypothetical protein CALVIDRAFT_532403 [Calocera viscosa TUFC12733]|uniref:Transmembrane protein n=1 Tax=Calocera viscosa (strain TUFC12733) TaxID=1330018 RepID=A0A167S6P9_CALVF|nr:hypothetical protein CALVIDRAFT_532403 [Calocera viscosa TUFC12733]